MYQWTEEVLSHKFIHPLHMAPTFFFAKKGKMNHLWSHTDFDLILLWILNICFQHFYLLFCFSKKHLPTPMTGAPSELLQSLVYGITEVLFWSDTVGVACYLLVTKTCSENRSIFCYVAICSRGEGLGGQSTLYPPEVRLFYSLLRSFYFISSIISWHSFFLSSPVPCCLHRFV